MGGCCDNAIRKPSTPYAMDQKRQADSLKNLFNDFNQGDLPSFSDNWDSAIDFNKLIKLIIIRKTDQIIKYIKDRQKLGPICFESLRGEISDFEIRCGEEQLKTTMWTPLLYVVAMKQFDVLKFILEECNGGCHTYLCLKEPIYDSEMDGLDGQSTAGGGGGETDQGKFWNSSISLQLAVQNGDIQTLDYLWNKLYYLWDISDLDSLIDSLYNKDFLDALSTVLRGKAFKSIILSMSFEDQVFYLEKLLFDKFDKDTLFSIASFIDDALSTKEFASQYLLLNLKREFFLKDLLDVCLHNSNHYLIFENGDIFEWIFEKIDSDVKKDLNIMETLVKNIMKGDKQVIEIKFAYSEILRQSREGNMTKLSKLIELAKVSEVNQIHDAEGLVMLSFPEYNDLLDIQSQISSSEEPSLKDWNPLHIAIAFSQMKVIRSFCEGLKINIRQTLKFPGYKSKSSSQVNLLNCEVPIITFLLECLKYNLKRGIVKQPEEALLYFWENHSYLFGEIDFKLLIETIFISKIERIMKQVMFTPTTVYIIKNLPFERRLVYLRELQYIGYKYLGMNKELIDGPIDQQSAQKHGNPNSNNRLLDEILCERPYALYGLFLFLDKNAQFLKQSLLKICPQDIEELVRCQFERALNLIQISKNQEKLRNMERDIEGFQNVKSDLKAFAKRIESSPYYQSWIKARSDQFANKLLENDYEYDQVKFKQKIQTNLQYF